MCSRACVVLKRFLRLTCNNFPMRSIARGGNRKKEEKYYHSNKHSPIFFHQVPSCEMKDQGSGGNMNAALWIWSTISSSSLKGKVPLKLNPSEGKVNKKGCVTWPSQSPAHSKLTLHTSPHQPTTDQVNDCSLHSSTPRGLEQQ